MAVLPASKAYPRGGAPRRQYVKGAPLFARMALKFGGVDYPRGAELPVGEMSPHKHWELWMAGKADHVARGPFDRKAPVAADAPVVTDSIDVLTDAELEKVAASEHESAAAAAPERPVIEQPVIEQPVIEQSVIEQPEPPEPAPEPAAPVTADAPRGRGKRR